jgi:hypothetical protein
MNLWRVALFEHRSDGKPSRVGYLFADTHEAASQIARATKAKCVRMDVTPSVMRPASMASTMTQIFWDD